MCQIVLLGVLMSLCAESICQVCYMFIVQIQYCLTPTSLPYRPMSKQAQRRTVVDRSRQKDEWALHSFDQYDETYFLTKCLK